MKFYKIAGYLLLSVIVFVAFYSLWGFGKQLSYTLIYKDLVQQTIREMVAAEELR